MTEKEYQRKYYLKTKELRRRQKHEWYLAHYEAKPRKRLTKSQRKEKVKAYYKKNPWLRPRNGARARCNNVNGEAYKYYGGRGIKCFLTIEETKEMWFRDKAYKMKRATIDRIDNNGHYCFENCQFLECSDNSKKQWKTYRNLKQGITC